MGHSMPNQPVAKPGHFQFMVILEIPISNEWQMRLFLEFFILLGFGVINF